MKVTGIISEYNPFHQGHLYHIQQTKINTNSDYIICVMNGNFVQRGEPAIVNKWARTEMALRCGADVVLELPVVFGVQSGEFFSYASIKILDSLNIVDFISFGSEYGQIHMLDKISDVLITEPQKYINLLKDNLNKGLSFASARHRALVGYLGEDVASVISSPNNILAIEYLKALKKLKSRIKPVTIKRIGAGYNSQIINDTISSATAIRKFIKYNPNNITKLNNNMPLAALQILNREFKAGRGPVFMNSFEQIILYQLRKLHPGQLLKYMDISEGLENRIIKYARQYATLESLIQKIKTKRYAYTRLSRIFINILLDISKDMINLFVKNGGPQYIRLLGFRSDAAPLLSYMNKHSSLPIISNTANQISAQNKLLTEMLHKEIFATNIYTLAYQNPKQRIAGLDYTSKPIIL